ncbi:MAG: hypothetical protein KDA58_11975 [Planctomycetaceae bacterium]|nr:hypothetical protein [Planctomycetaceae bacterium]
MTSPEKPLNDEDSAAPTDAAQSTNDADAAAATGDAPAAPAAGTDAQAPSAPAVEDHDPLPEEEELTPEYIEDECLRGDVMLRWAALLIAVLLSWTVITETSVLVQVRSGEYMLTHGVLPPRADPFSASAAGQTWVNLGWLADIVLGGLSKAGLWALTLCCVLCTGFAFRQLNQLSFPKVTTWWASICLVLTALTLFPILQPGQGSVTLLGLALLCWLLFRADQHSSARLMWQLPLLMCLWSNSDPRAFLGLLLLTGWMLGSVVKPPQASSTDAVLLTATDRLKLWGVGVIAALLHPWHYHVLLAPYTRLFVVAPELKTYGEVNEFGSRWLIHGLLDPEFWQRLDLFAYLGLTLLILAIITQLMNISRLHFGWLCGWLLVNLCGLWSAEMFACAAVVNAVVAILNGQDWFRHTCSQEFRIDAGSIFFGRAGRAVTVLGMFVVAYAAINGWLMGPDGRRIGMGLDPRWQDRAAGVQSLLDNVYEDRVFPLRLDQGDLLIWLGQQPYVDSRLALYSSGGRNLLDDHRAIRTAMRTERSTLLGSGKPDVWQAGLKEFATYAVMPRMWGDVPDYSTFFDLLLTGWRLSGLSATGAVLYPPELNDPDALAFAQEHQLPAFLKTGVREPNQDSLADGGPTWPTRPSTYDRWLMQRRSRTNNFVQLAAHYNTLRAGLSNRLPLPQVLGLTEASLRYARRGLQESPNDPVAYRVLREGYAALGQLEQVLAESQGVQFQAQLRSTQALAAGYHAYQASGSVEDLYHLMMLQLSTQQLDLALESLTQFRDEHGSLTLLPLSEPAGLQEQTNNESILSDLEKLVGEVRDKVEEMRGQGESMQQLVAVAIGNRCPGIALEVIERDKTIVAQNPDLSMLYSGLMLSAGRAEEARDSLEAMERYFPNDRLPPQQLPMFQQWCRQTAQANLAALDLNRAIDLLRRAASAQSRSALRSLLESPSVSSMPANELDISPALTVALALGLETQYHAKWDQTQLELASLELEAGFPERSVTEFERLLENHPNSSARPLAAAHLSILVDQFVDPVPPVDRIPITGDMFVPDEE